MKKNRRFPTQIILIFISIVVVTVLAVGIPAILIIRSQLNGQAWSQIHQGIITSRAFYQAKENEVVSLAMLTAQRPTLQELIKSGDTALIEDYLTTLQGGTDLDLIAICTQNNQTLAYTSRLPQNSPCQFISSDHRYHILGDNSDRQLWLTAINSISELDSYVITGEQIDDQFAQEIKAQTGLDHAIRVGDENSLISSTIPALRDQSELEYRVISQPIPELQTAGNYLWRGESFFAASSQLIETPGIKIQVLFPTTGIRETQSLLVQNLFLSLTGVTLIVSIIGVLIARQISHPLVQLADAATAFSKGNLQKEVKVASPFWEISQVANALENARGDLLDTMTRLTQEKMWVDHLLASIVEGVMTINQEGEITFFSLGAERITGWQGDDLLGRSADEVFHLPESEDSFRDAIPEPGKRKKIVVALAGQNQTTLAFTGAELAPTVVREAQVVLVFRDISEEEAIHRLLGNFLSNIAHEFRTPLSALTASIELLLDAPQESIWEENQELLSSLHLGIVALNNLVNNLLEAASIEAGHFHISPREADPGEMIASAVQIMSPLMKKYRQHLSVELPADNPVVTADHRRVIQVLVNLLSNAIKYGPEGGEISVRAKKKHDWFLIEVIDQGPGIPEQDQEAIFHRFTRLETPQADIEVGAGLGLSVVKEIIQAHGGQVGVANRPERGAIFSFTLPIAGRKKTE